MRKAGSVFCSYYSPFTAFSTAKEALIKYGFVIPAKAGIPFPRLRGESLRSTRGGLGWGLH